MHEKKKILGREKSAANAWRYETARQVRRYETATQVRGPASPGVWLHLYQCRVEMGGTSLYIDLSNRITGECHLHVMAWIQNCNDILGTFWFFDWRPLSLSNLSWERSMQRGKNPDAQELRQQTSFPEVLWAISLPLGRFQLNCSVLNVS